MCIHSSTNTFAGGSSSWTACHGDTRPGAAVLSGQLLVRLQRLHASSISPATCASSSLKLAAPVQLRDREMELKTQISAITAGKGETEKAEEAAGEGAGPMVTDADIATIVSQWTRIPVEKVGMLPANCLGWVNTDASVGPALRVCGRMMVPAGAWHNEQHGCLAALCALPPWAKRCLCC